jgi:hypothetical protein
MGGRKRKGGKTLYDLPRGSDSRLCMKLDCDTDDYWLIIPRLARHVLDGNTCHIIGPLTGKK